MAARRYGLVGGARPCSRPLPGSRPCGRLVRSQPSATGVRWGSVPGGFRAVRSAAMSVGPPEDGVGVCASRPEPVRSSGSRARWKQLRLPLPARRRRNVKKATAAVMRCGCRRGGFFEGCETRRGERRPPHRPVRRAVRPTGNAANPMVGSGMQQARALRCGANRRGGAKPRGRNTSPGMVPGGPKPAATSVGVDAAEHTTEGHTTNPMRGGQPRSAFARSAGRPARSRSSEGEAKPAGARQAGQPVRTRATRVLEGPPGNGGKAMEGAGKTNDPRRRSHRVYRFPVRFRTGPRRLRRGGPYGPRGARQRHGSCRPATDGDLSAA